MGVSKLAAYSVFRLVPVGKERRLTATLACCSSGWQNESGKAGVKKGTGARAGPEASHSLVGKLFCTGRSSRERPVWFSSSDERTAHNMNQNIAFYGKVFILAVVVVLFKEDSMFRRAVAS